MNVEHTNDVQGSVMAFFGSPRVEEEPWFPANLFVSPISYGPVNGNGSYIIFGTPGSGKTAAIRSLKNFAKARQILCVDWNFNLYEEFLPSESYIAEKHLYDVFTGVASELISLFFEKEDLFDRLDKYTQRFFLAFLYLMSKGEAGAIVDPRIGVLDETQRSFLKKIDDFVFTDDVLISEKTPTATITQKLIYQLPALGFRGIWVFLDGVETGYNEKGKIELLGKNLALIFQNKPTFEQIDFSYKISLPNTFFTDLIPTGVLQTDRAQHITLTWDEDLLTEIIEKRIRASFTDPNMSLASVYSQEKFLNWLRHCGGDTPRGWLELARPIVHRFASKVSDGETEPLSPKEWSSACKVSSVTLGYDTERELVRVGQREVDLSPQEMALFKYLYEKSLQSEKIPVNRKELFDQVLLPIYLGEEGPVDGDQNEFPKDYEDLVNTALYRLRQAIEPNHKKPIFIHTKRGKGVYLTRTAQIK